MRLIRQLTHCDGHNIFHERFDEFEKTLNIVVNNKNYNKISDAVKYAINNLGHIITINNLIEISFHLKKGSLVYCWHNLSYNQGRLFYAQKDINQNINDIEDYIFALED